MSFVDLINNIIIKSTITLIKDIFYIIVVIQVYLGLFIYILIDYIDYM